MLPRVIQDIQALVLCHRRGKIEASTGSTIGYRRERDVIDIVPVAHLGQIVVRDIYYCPTLRSCLGDDRLCDIDRALRVSVGGIFVAEILGCLHQLDLMGVLDMGLQVGDTAWGGRRIHWGNNDGVGTRGGALDWGTRHCATGAFPLLESVGEVFVEGLDR